MNYRDEQHWEHFSDLLSDVLDDVAATHGLGAETIDILHGTVVRIYIENQQHGVEEPLAILPARHLLH